MSVFRKRGILAGLGDGLWCLCCSLLDGSRSRQMSSECVAQLVDEGWPWCPREPGDRSIGLLSRHRHSTLLPMSRLCRLAPFRVPEVFRAP